MPIRLVIFDLAGTLVDFGCQAPVAPFQTAFAHFQIPTTTAQVRQFMGLYKKDHIREMLKLPELQSAWQAAHGRPSHEADVIAMYEIVTQEQTRAAAEHADLVPDALATAHQLRQRGIRIATTTGYFRAAAEQVWRATAAQGLHVDFQICADDVPAGRPAPWMIFRAMEATGIYPVGDVLKIGDTRVDIDDGCNAGVHSWGVVDSSNEMGLSLAEFKSLTAGERQTRRQAVVDAFQSRGAERSIFQLEEMIPYLDGSGTGPQLQPEERQLDERHK